MGTAPESLWIWQRAGWPSLRWDLARLAGPLAAARRAQGRIASVARLFDPDLDLRAQLELLTLESASTAAIEGERLDPLALRSSIARHLGLPTTGLPRSTRAIDGLVEVLTDATERHAAPVDVERLCGWQAALFPTGRSGITPIRAGALRGEQPMRIVSGPDGRERVHFVAPPRDALDGELARLVAWIEAPPPELDGLLRAGVVHAWFEVLHPFEDGNGRVGRALLDLMLARDEASATRFSSVSARFLDRRSEYYAELEQLSSGDLEITPWLLWLVDQVRGAAEASETTLATVLGRARFWAKHAAAVLSERQRKVLNRMLDAGVGGFEGGMTTRKYVHLTGASAATAQRDLAALVVLGCLRPAGSGRAARYELVPA